MIRAEEKYVDPGQFLFGILFGTLISVFLGSITVREEEGDMATATEALPPDAVPVEMVGQTADELSRGLSMMERTMAEGQKVRIELVTDSMPTGDDLAQFYHSLIADGHHVSRPTAKIVGGFPVTSIVMKKGSPALALLVPIIPTVLILGLITFGIFRIEKIANALMPILVVSFAGLIVLAIILTRKPVLSAAEKIATRQKLLASTIVDVQPQTESQHDKAEGQERVWILSGGGTVHNHNQMVSRREYEEENRKALERGEMPATGEIWRGGKWQRLPQTIEYISQEIPILSACGNPLAFDLCPDSPEYLAHTIDMTGWRQKLDQTFQEAVVRARRS